MSLLQETSSQSVAFELFGRAPSIAGRLRAKLVLPARNRRRVRLPGMPFALLRRGLRPALAPNKMPFKAADRQNAEPLELAQVFLQQVPAHDGGGHIGWKEKSAVEPKDHE